MSIVGLLWSISAILISCSYIFTDILILRILAILGGIGYIIGSCFMPEGADGKVASIFFSSVNTVINLYHAIRIILNRLPILIPDHLKQIYQQTFKSLTPKEFLKLYQLGITEIKPKNDVLTVAGKAERHLYYLCEGEVDIRKEGKVLNKIGQGFFLGEMSYLKESDATADVIVASNELKIIAWDKSSIDSLERSAPYIFDKLKKIISLDLVNKIERGIELD